MKCYCIANETDEGAVAVNGGKYIKPCEYSESELSDIIEQINTLEICYEEHWDCSADNDNGIEDHRVETSVRPFELSQAVLANGELYGAYLKPYNFVLKKGYKQSIDSYYEGHLGGWGEISGADYAYIQTKKDKVIF